MSASGWVAIIGAAGAQLAALLTIYLKNRSQHAETTAALAGIKTSVQGAPTETKT